MSDRRAFWPPGEVHEATESFCIRDASGQALAYVYYENEKGRLPTAAAALASASDRPAINVVAAEVLLASASRWPPTHFALCRSDLCPGLSMRQVDGALVLSKPEACFPQGRFASICDQYSDRSASDTS